MADERKRDRSRQPAYADVARDRGDRVGERDRESKRKKQLDDRLERGLEETFPGSDAVAVTQPLSSPWDQREP